MTLTLLRILLPPLLLGMGLTRLFGLAPRSDRLAWLGWAWMFGTMGTALVTFAWIWTPLPIDSALAPELAVLALAALVWWFAPRVQAAPPAEVPPAPAWERALFGLSVAFLAVLTVQRILDGNLFPIFEDDEAHVWALKAKVIFHSGGFTPEFRETLQNEHFVYHRDYPMLHPLLHIWTFAHFGEITQVVNRLPIQLFALAFVPVFASALRRAVRPAAAVAVMFIVMQAGETVRQGRTAHADMAVALGLIVLFESWMRWRAEAHPAWWRLACGGAAMMLYAKGEGLLIALAIGCALVGARVLGGGIAAEVAPARAPRARRAWLLLPLFIAAQTWVFNASFGFKNDIGAGDMREETFLGLLALQWRERLEPIASWSWEHMLPHMKWAGHLPVVFLLLMAVTLPRLRKHALFVPALALPAAFLGYLLIFLGTPHDVIWHLGSAAPRITWQLVPAMGLWVAAAAGRFLPGFFASAAEPAPTRRP